MHRLFLVLSLALFGLFAQLAPAQRIAADIAAPNRGTLYRIVHDGHTAYLFGTIHVGQASFYPLEPVVLRALAQSGKLAVELDIRDQPPLTAALQKYLVPAEIIVQGTTLYRTPRLG